MRRIQQAFRRQLLQGLADRLSLHAKTSGQLFLRRKHLIQLPVATGNFGAENGGDVLPNPKAAVTP
jgi:hypothetical protein